MPGELLVKQALPSVGHGTGGAGCGLVQRMVVRRSELRTGVHASGLEVPEPLLLRLEALDVPVPGCPEVRLSVLGRRGVAAPDVATLGAASEVEPPSARLSGEAFDAAVT